MGLFFCLSNTFKFQEILLLIDDYFHIGGKYFHLSENPFIS